MVCSLTSLHSHIQVLVILQIQQKHKPQEMFGMSETKNNPEGIRVSQQPGGRSNFTLKWLSPEPVRENRLENRHCISPRGESNVLRTIQTAGSPRKFCVKIANPPGGKTTLKLQ